MSHPTYLDHNATTPVSQAVIACMAEVLRQPYNASSVHGSGREARKIVEEAREAIRKAVNAGDAQIIFTASGTEANNLALKGVPSYTPVISAIEHASVRESVPENTVLIPVNEKGVVRVDALPTLGKKSLISVMLANNETGVIQPVHEITKKAHAQGALVHSDAAQAFGKIPVDMEALGVDMLTLSAHKCGGPQGVGALIVRKGIDLVPLLTGGGQELRKRSGTENVAAIAGFGVAVSLLSERIKAVDKVAALRNQLEASLPQAVVFGKEAERLPNTSCLALKGMRSDTQLIAYDMEGIAVSSGSACSSGKVATSHVLLAMGVPEKLASCAIRVSLGVGTTEADIERFVSVWKGLAARV